MAASNQLPVIPFMPAMFSKEETLVYQGLAHICAPDDEGNPQLQPGDVVPSPFFSSKLTLMQDYAGNFVWVSSRLALPTQPMPQAAGNAAAHQQSDASNNTGPMVVTSDPSLITTPSYDYRNLTYQVISLLLFRSDGRMQSPPPDSGWKFEAVPAYVLIQLAAAWREKEGLAPSPCIFSRLPLNYTVWRRERSTGVRTDREVYGHPKGAFRTVKKFLVHAVHLIENRVGDTGDCPCCMCTSR